MSRGTDESKEKVNVDFPSRWRWGRSLATSPCGRWKGVSQLRAESLGSMCRREREEYGKQIRESGSSSLRIGNTERSEREGRDIPLGRER